MLEDPDLRSPCGFDSGLSPSAQDDTKGRFCAILMIRATISNTVATILLTDNAETNESLLQWEKVAAGG